MKILCEGWGRVVNQYELFNEELTSENVQLTHDAFSVKPWNPYHMRISTSDSNDEIQLGFRGGIGENNYFFDISFSLSELLPYIGQSIKHLQLDKILESVDESHKIKDAYSKEDEEDEDEEDRCSFCYQYESSVKSLFHDNTDAYICNECVAKATTTLLAED